MVLLLSGDLLFASRFHAAAAQAGIESQGALSASQVVAAVERGGVSGLCVDLEAGGLEIAGLVADVKSRGPIQIVAYGPHVHEERLAAALAAGCDQVLSRGQFDRSLPELLQRLASPT
jgi:hypothetical protein